MPMAVVAKRSCRRESEVARVSAAASAMESTAPTLPTAMPVRETLLLTCRAVSQGTGASIAGGRWVRRIAICREVGKAGSLGCQAVGRRKHTWGPHLFPCLKDFAAGLLLHCLEEHRVRIHQN